MKVDNCIRKLKGMDRKERRVQLSEWVRTKHICRQEFYVILDSIEIGFVDEYEDAEKALYYDLG